MLPLRHLLRSRAATPRLLPTITQFSTPYSSSSSSTPSNNNPAKGPNQPALPHTKSTLTPDIPSAGKRPVPPEFLGSVQNPPATPQSWSGSGSSSSSSGHNEPNHAGGKSAAPIDASPDKFQQFDLPPIKREGEDDKTMIARLFYQSRKRGILESDLLLSTFADANLTRMSREQLEEYDSFLNENDWDIYYWCTQDSPAATQSAATSDAGADFIAQSGAATTASPTNPSSKIAGPPGVLGGMEEDPVERKGGEGGGGIEWAQTVGTVKVAYREVPERWRGSWVLGALREHVEGRRARGGETGGVKKGMGRMPELREY